MLSLEGMILEKPLWVLEQDSRWTTLERKKAFLLQQYKYGGLGKGKWSPLHCEDPPAGFGASSSECKVRGGGKVLCASLCDVPVDKAFPDRLPGEVSQQRRRVD